MQILLDLINFFKVPEIVMVVKGGLQQDSVNRTFSILTRLHRIIKQFMEERSCLWIKVIFAFSNSIDPNSSKKRIIKNLLKIR